MFVSWCHWNGAGPYGPSPRVLSLTLSVEKLEPRNKFNQRSEKMQKQRSQTGQNNNSLVSKQSQGPLVPSQGL